MLIKLSEVASQESYHSTLAKAGQLYLLDLRSLPTGGVSHWFDGPQAFRDYDAEHMADDDNYQDVSLSAWFDVILQVDKISPTQLLPRAEPALVHFRGLLLACFL